MLATKKGKQKPTRSSDSFRSISWKTVRFRRWMWLANASVIVLSVALGSIPPANFIPSSISPSTQGDPSEIVGSTFLMGRLDRLLDAELATGETPFLGEGSSVRSAGGVQRAANVSVGTPNLYPPGEHLIIRR